MYQSSQPLKYSTLVNTNPQNTLSDEMDVRENMFDMCRNVLAMQSVVMVTGFRNDPKTVKAPRPHSNRKRNDFPKDLIPLVQLRLLRMGLNDRIPKSKIVLGPRGRGGRQMTATRYCCQSTVLTLCMIWKRITAFFSLPGLCPCSLLTMYD